MAPSKLSPRAFIDENALWPHPGFLAVCWSGEQAGRDLEKGWVQDAIESTWEQAARINFVGWEPCDASSSPSALEIRVLDEGPYTLGLGSNTEHMVLNFDFENWGCDGEPCLFDQEERELAIRQIAIHEFGHALGLSHEHNRPDTPEDCPFDAQGPDGTKTMGEWDDLSVMNYCTFGDGLQLSVNDQNAVQYMYGANRSFVFSDLLGASLAGSKAQVSSLVGIQQARQVFTADLRGQDLHDLLAVFETPDRRVFVNRYRNQGQARFDRGSTGMVLPRFFADRAWCSGDTQGNGRDEIIAIASYPWGSLVWAFGSQRGRLVPANYALSVLPAQPDSAQWEIGDYNGDGTEDLWSLVPADDSLLVRGYPSQKGRILARGFETTMPTTDQHRWQLATVNDDAYTDLVSMRVLSPSNLQVCVHPGSASGPTSSASCSNVDLRGQEPQFKLGDFNGDGLDDLAILTGESAQLSVTIHPARDAGGFEPKGKRRVPNLGYWNQRHWQSAQLDDSPGLELLGVW